MKCKFSLLVIVTPNSSTYMYPLDEFYRKTKYSELIVICDLGKLFLVFYYC